MDYSQLSEYFETIEDALQRFAENTAYELNEAPDHDEEALESWQGDYQSCENAQAALEDLRYVIRLLL